MGFLMPTKLPTNKIIHGDTLKTTQQLPNKSVNSVITSPPYWQLRDYGYPEQWGLEPTFQEYLNHLWLLMDEIWRVLKDDGTVWINLGDTYMNNSSYSEKGRQGLGNDKIGMIYKSDEKVKQKSLCLIPHRFAIGCIDRGWIVRNDIIWAKRNGMPEGVTDRFSKKHEYFFLMVKQPKYYFDLDGIRDKVLSNDKVNANVWNNDFNTNRVRCGANKNGKNPGDVSDFWDVPTMPSSEKHYATYNTKLIDKPIIAGCPKDGIILDPFAGTGTTLVRALQLGRKVIGIDGSKEYCEIAQKRVDNELSQFKMDFK